MNGIERKNDIRSGGPGNVFMAAEPVTVNPVIGKRCAGDQGEDDEGLHCGYSSEERMKMELNAQEPVCCCPFYSITSVPWVLLVLM